MDAGLGAGPAPVPAWSTVIDNCDSYGKAEVLGYVWTDYGKGGAASIPAIEAEVKDWYSFYPGHIAGIFFDGAADAVPGTGASNVSFYQTLDSYVHQNWRSNDEVVLNYGANPASGWMFNSSNAKNADIVVIFEGSYSTTGENPYVGGGWAPASWESQYPADDFAALMYDTNSTATVPQPATACSALTAQHIGYLYVGTWYTDPGALFLHVRRRLLTSTGQARPATYQTAPRLPTKKPTGQFDQKEAAIASHTVTSARAEDRTMAATGRSVR